MLKVSEKTAIISGDKKFSFAELSQYAQCCAELFKKNGKYSKIALFAPNSHQWAFAFYGAIFLKSIVIPIDEQSQPADLEYILKDVVPDIIFTTEDRRGSVLEIIKKVGIDCKVVSFDDVDTAKAAGIEPVDIQAGAPDEIALIVYTSGTSGTPKGVMLSYRNILYNVDAVSKQVPIYNADRNVMILLPLHHAFPLMGSLVAPIKVGATVVFAEKLNAESILHTLSIGKIAIIIGVPRLYELLAKGIMSKIRAKLITRIIYKIAEKIGSQSFSKFIFSAVHKKFGGHLDYLVSGGAALPNNIAKIYKALGFYMLNGYGMTETGPMISFTRPGEWK
ncbi:AMP-binding protein, partial [bacterium]|nr:AMP-binding protein [bacterium]